MNPDHLLDQAEALLTAPANGAPRQADKRRAVSAAYYAVFHALLIAAANQFVGQAHRDDPAYSLAYRSLTHGRVKKVCLELHKTTPQHTWMRESWPAGGFATGLATFGPLFVQLIGARHSADYDPSWKINTATARALVDLARQAIAVLDKADPVQLRLLLVMAALGGRAGEA